MPRSRIKLALLLVAFAFLGVCLWNPIRQAIGVTALQESAKAQSETIYFGCQGDPERLPVFLINTAQKCVKAFFPKSFVPRAEEPLDLWRSRFRGPITIISLPLPIKEDASTAIARLPHLRRLIVCGYDLRILPLPERCLQPEWERFCASLHACRNVQELEVHGERVTDVAIAPLARHPGIRSLTICRGALTLSSIATFTTLPRLAELRITNLSQVDGAAVLSPSDLVAVRTALPNVRVVIDAPLEAPIRRLKPTAPPPPEERIIDVNRIINPIP